MAPLLELGKPALEFPQLGLADGAVQAAKEHDHREEPRSLIGEAVGASAQAAAP
jgi:hypothetical protein